MQNDDVIWQIINHQFCSFKSKIARERTFCLNEYNVTGLCIRSACPLANSKYATIREENGDCYLFIKTIERAHSPKNLWEKIKLPSNYTQALEIVSKELEHFPKYLVHRNKQRLTKIHQMLIRMRKLSLKARPKIVTTNAHVEAREKGRERKALLAAKLDRAIENELLERLRQATEGEIFNYPEQQYSKVIGKATDKYQKESGEQEVDPDEEELEEELEEEELEEEEEEIPDYNIEYVEDFEPSDDEDEGSSEDEGDADDSDRLSKKRTLDATDLEEIASKWIARSNGGAKGGKTATPSTSNSKKKGSTVKTGRVEVEYEREDEDEELDRETKRATQYNSTIGGSTRKSARIAAASDSMHFNF